MTAEFCKRTEYLRIKARNRRRITIVIANLTVGAFLVGWTFKLLGPSAYRPIPGFVSVFGAMIAILGTAVISSGIGVYLTKTLAINLTTIAYKILSLFCAIPAGFSSIGLLLSLPSAFREDQNVGNVTVSLGTNHGWFKTFLVIWVCSCVASAISLYLWQLSTRCED